MNSVLGPLILRLTLSAHSSIDRIMICILIAEEGRTAMSSAKSRSVTYTAGKVQRDLVPTQNPSEASGTAFRIIQSIINTNGYCASSVCAYLQVTRVVGRNKWSVHNKGPFLSLWVYLHGFGSSIQGKFCFIQTQVSEKLLIPPNVFQSC